MSQCSRCKKLVARATEGFKGKAVAEWTALGQSPFGEGRQVRKVRDLRAHRTVKAEGRHSL